MKYFTKEEKEKFLLSDYLKMSDDMFKKEIFKESEIKKICPTSILKK